MLRLPWPKWSKATANSAFLAAGDSNGGPSIGDSTFRAPGERQEPYVYELKGKVHFIIGINGGKRANQKQLDQTKALAAPSQREFETN